LSFTLGISNCFGFSASDAAPQLSRPLRNAHQPQTAPLWRMSGKLNGYASAAGKARPKRPAGRLAGSNRVQPHRPQMKGQIDENLAGDDRGHQRSALWWGAR
jgi:hypothetical protein